MDPVAFINNLDNQLEMVSRDPSPEQRRVGFRELLDEDFDIPGLGRFMVDSIARRDFPVIQGGVLLIALSFSFVNLMVDVLYAYVDPRIRSQYR